MPVSGLEFPKRRHAMKEKSHTGRGDDVIALAEKVQAYGMRVETMCEATRRLALSGMHLASVIQTMIKQKAGPEER